MTWEVLPHVPMLTCPPLDSSLESLADIAHTKDGSSVVREFLSRGTAKVSRIAQRSMTSS